MHSLELDFEQAKTRHLLFKTRLKSILYGAEIDEQPVVSHIDCSLGKWIYEHALQSYGHIPETHQLEHVHTTIHALAKELISLYKNGKIEEARCGLIKIERIADTILSLLTTIERKLKQSNYPASSVDASNELLKNNYKELLELHSTLRELDVRISKQAEAFSATQHHVENKLRSHFSHAPVAICILRGSDFVIELANDLYLELVDKQSDFIDKKLFDALPELEGQGIREMLNGVLNSGTPFIGNEVEVILNRNGFPATAYFNFIYKSLEDADSVPGIMVVCSEVTAQVLAKKSLVENEQRLNIAVEASSLGTYEVDLKTGEFINSDRHLEIFGFAPQDKPNHQDLINFVHPDDLCIRTKAFNIAYQTSKLFYELRIIMQDGSIKWIRASGKLFFDDKNVPEKMFGTTIDITEEKLAEEKIRKANEVLEIALQSAQLGTYELNIKSGKANFSKLCKEIFGFDSNQDVTIDHIRAATYPDDKEITRLHMLDALTSKRNYDAEYRIITADSSVRWVSTSGKGVYDEEGNLKKLIGVMENITDRKNAEEELNLSVQKFRLLADSMPQFVWTGDTAGNLNYFNQSVFDYAGLTPTQIYLEGWLQIVHPDDREENIKKWMHAIETGEDFLCEHRFKKHSGEYRWQLSRAIAQRNKAGEIQMWVGTSTDIQDQKTFAQDLEARIKERTKELKNANLELESMNQELRSFAYISSHDLQEPLRKIQTFVSRIQDSDETMLSPEGKTYFERIQQSAHKMKTLINDLLTYSRTSAADRIFERTNLNLLLQEIKNEFTDSLKEKNGTLEIHALAEMNAIPFQLRQLFINLISNALKFTKENTPPLIEISSSSILGKNTGNEHAHENEWYQQLTVRDNGIGFDSAYKEKIFEVFQRLHAKTEYEGTGIGLSICNKIAQNHNGFITTESEKGKGATFHIYLPMNLQ
ncbi:PAS domain-containing protein [Cytophaga aurantiaca]|uniref:PAS domain-containing protein n=1 Tax=Cytophaga aurantiaca TaxID=29530 RepID=UPI00036B2F6F|nr:PAS domain-containing protein [Cytophaga aurantiaca]